MNKELCVVQYGDIKRVVAKRDIVDSHIDVIEYGDDEFGYTNSYSVKHKVTILSNYIINIYADFVYNNGRPVLGRKGMGFGNTAGLKYFYSVTIVSVFGTDAYVHYTDSGVKITRFDMYSYSDDGVWDSACLSFELFDTLDLDKMIIWD